MGNLGGSRFVLLVLFIAFLNIFLFHWFGSVGFAVAGIGFFLFLVGLFVDSRHWGEQKFGVLGVLGLLGVLLGLLISRGNGFVELVLGGSVVATLVVFLYLMASRIPFVRSLLELVLIPLSLGWSYVAAILQTVRVLTTSDTFGSDSRTWFSRLKPIVLGVVISLPIVIVLTSLFAWADPIYRVRLDEWVKQWTELEFVRRLKTRTLFSVVSAIVLGPLLLLHRSSGFHSPLSRFRLTFHREMTIVMVTVGLVLGSFLVVQWPYVFVNVPAETDLSKFGVATYSEYVKRGFTELLAITLFLYAMIWAGLVFLRQAAHRSRGLLTAQLLVIAEFSIFLISIARRVWLYQLYHGLTLGRIYGSFLLLWIAIMTATLLLRHFWHRRFVIAEVVATIAVMLTIGLFNAEDYVARKHPPTVNHRVDYVYLSRMSSDGTEGWKRAYEYAEEVLMRRGYESKPLLDREDRREVAYVSIILSHLTDHYNDLIYRYGSDKELRGYEENVLFHLQQGITSERDRIVAHLQSLRVIGNTDQMLQDRLVKYQEDIAHVEKRLMEGQERIEKIDRSERTRSIHTLRDDFPSFDIPPPTAVSGVEITCRSFFCLRSVEQPTVSGKSHKDDIAFLDFLLSWNGSQERSYRFMKREIPHMDLIRLYQQYLVLHEKIASQPEGERDYDIDISFSTPFL